MSIAIGKQLKLVNYSLYVVYIWLIVFILTSYTLQCIFIATRSFYDEKRLT